MPLIPAQPKWYTRGLVIALVGAAVMTTANAICALLGASVEVHGVVTGVVAAWLAVWRAVGATQLPATVVTEDVDKAEAAKAALRNRIGPTLLVLLCGVPLAIGCATTLTTMKPIEREGVGDIVRGAWRMTIGTLRVYDEGRAADLLAAVEDDVVAGVLGSLEYPTDSDAVAGAIIATAVKTLIEFRLETAARIVNLCKGLVRWAIEEALGAQPPPGAPSAAGTSFYRPIRGPTPDW